MTAELHWFPMLTDKWLSSPAISRMLPEQEGAYLRLLIVAWGDGGQEPSLPADAGELAVASRLGSRWRKLGPLVREQFKERDGRLFNTKLSKVWREQQQKHAVAVVKGGKGGKKKAENAKLRASSATSPSSGQVAEYPHNHLAEPLATENSEGTLVGPTDPTSSPPATALALEAPRTPEPREMDESGTSSAPTTLGAELEKFAQNIIPMHRKRA